MKHLYETIFNQGDAIRWLNMPHWEEYYAVLEKIRGGCVDYRAFDNVMFRTSTVHSKNFLALIVRNGKRIYNVPEKPSGCYAFYFDTGETYIIDYDRDIRIGFIQHPKVLAVTMQKNSNWIPKAPKFYTIDPLLIDIIKDVLLS